MKIYIKYNDSWRVTNLIGTQEAFHNKIRPCVADLESLNSENKKFNLQEIETYPKKEKITLSTIWGILYRLVGDVRPLHMIRLKDHYLNFILNENIDFYVEDESKTAECLTFQNIGNRYNKNLGYYNQINPNSWKGEIIDNNKIFIEKDLYQVLLFPFTCTPTELYELIVNDKYLADTTLKIRGRLSILSLYDKIKQIKAEDSFSNDPGEDLLLRKNILNSLKEKINRAQIFSTDRVLGDVEYEEKDLKSYSCFVLGAVYLSFLHLCEKYKITKNKNESTKETIWECDKFGVIQNNKQSWNKGLSPRGTLTFKDLVGAISEKVNTSIYPIDENIREKKTKVEVSNGTLIIDLKIDEENAQDFMKMIEEANIGIFRIGKKGTAYIEEIEL